MCPHPVGSRSEKAWITWAKGVVFGCVVTGVNDEGPSVIFGKDTCSERYGGSGKKRDRVVKNPTSEHGSRGAEARNRGKFDMEE